MATGLKADRRPDPDRPRPARADHRRPPDRQDRDRARHDPEPEGDQPAARTRAQKLYCVYVAIGQKRSTVAQFVKVLEEQRRAGILDHRRRDRLRPGPDAVPGAVRRLRHGRVLPRQRHARRHHLRRPVQAGRRLPPDVAAAAPPAGPRGLSRRRVLPALAACSSAPPSSTRPRARARSPRCRSSRRRPTTCRPTSRPT